MKVYLLYSNPYDEGAENYGVFSTEEKAEKAREILIEKSNHELYISEMEVDALEEYFDRARLPERLYILYRMKFAFHGGKWGVSVCGLDAFIENNHKEDVVVEWKNYTSASIMAKSEEEAVEIAEKMISEGRVLNYEN